MKEVRLQKYLASCGVASRRACEKLIEDGKIFVNGKRASIGDKIDTEYDKVVYNGNQIKSLNKKIYIMLNKPVGYITSANDDRGRKTIYELINKDINERVFPVGRLDYNTEGLLILTNDGDFANKIIHPKNKISKTYLVQIKGGIISPENLRKLRNGVKLDDGVTKPAKVNIDTILDNQTTILTVTIEEGKNRQIRRMFEAVGHEVINLKRIEIGGVMLGNLAYGRWRHLKQGEIERLSK